jgi:hypothetical protein
MTTMTDRVTCPCLTQELRLVSGCRVAGAFIRDALVTLSPSVFALVMQALSRCLSDSRPCSGIRQRVLRFVI